MVPNTGEPEFASTSRAGSDGARDLSGARHHRAERPIPSELRKVDLLERDDGVADFDPAAGVHDPRHRELRLGHDDLELPDLQVVAPEIADIVARALDLTGGADRGISVARGHA